MIAPVKSVAWIIARQPFRNGYDFITSVKKKRGGKERVRKETTFQQTWNFPLSLSLQPSKLIVDHVDKFRAAWKEWEPRPDAAVTRPPQGWKEEGDAKNRALKFLAGGKKKGGRNSRERERRERKDEGSK